MTGAVDRELSREEQGWLEGRAGEATRLALELVVRTGDLFGAARLLPITQAHIDACLYTCSRRSGNPLVLRPDDPFPAAFFTQGEGAFECDDFCGSRS